MLACSHLAKRIRLYPEKMEGTRKREISACHPSPSCSSNLKGIVPVVPTTSWRSVVSFESLPAWLRDNEFLLSHHRPPMGSIIRCTKTIFSLHTQTWNIWTHLLGFILFLSITVSVFLLRDSITHLFEESVTISDLPLHEQAIVSLFFIAAMICLFCSTAYHTLSNHSENFYTLFCQLDYTGIALLIAGSNIPAFYYCFYCRPFSRTLHIGMITFLLTGCIVFSLFKTFRKHSHRFLRFIVFASFGFYGGVPTLQLYLEKGPVEPYWSYLVGLGLMAGLYTGGALLYVTRIPERLYPGLFDIHAHSHQLFHVCVIMAALVHYYNLINMIKNRFLLDDCIGAL